MRLALAAAAPQAGGEHPEPQCPHRYLQIVVLSQMLGRQSRPEALVRFAGVVFAHQLQHSLANFRRLGAVRYAAHIAVPQRLGPSCGVASPDPLDLAITDLEHLRRLAQLQLASLHPAQYLAPSQFLVVHRCPFQSRLLLRSLRLGDISIALSRGHYHRPSTHNRNVPLRAKLLSPFALLSRVLFSRRQGSGPGRARRAWLREPLTGPSASPSSAC